LQNPHPDVPKEVLTVSLNPDCSNIPYLLGRLFSTLEAIQSAANPGINTTIMDKYFNSASATPAMVFPVLLKLAQKHLKKLDVGLRTYYDKQLTDLLSRLGEEYPARLNLPQQGSFQLGYYHQTQARYEKKEDKKNV
jgi:CRISPR-associated protein Csd1